MQIFVRAVLRLMGARVTADLGAESAEAELRGAIDLHADATGERRRQCETELPRRHRSDRRRLSARGNIATWRRLGSGHGSRP